MQVSRLRAIFATGLIQMSRHSDTRRLQCFRDHASDLAEVAACGDEGSIAYCFGHELPHDPELFSQQDLETCLLHAGCTEDEARIEAAWTIKRCDMGLLDGSLGDLRRRSQPLLVARADATTTSDATTKSTSTSTSSSSSTATTATSTATATTATATTATSTASTASSDAGTSNTCYTLEATSVSFCPVQSTGTASGQTLSCYATTTTTSACRAGYTCGSLTDTSDRTCMKYDNSVSSAGIAIAIILCSIVFVAISSICFFCMRERRHTNRLREAAEASALAAASASLIKKKQRPAPSMSRESIIPLHDADRPLMAPQMSPGLPPKHDGSL